MCRLLVRCYGKIGTPTRLCAGMLQSFGSTSRVTSLFNAPPYIMQRRTVIENEDAVTSIPGVRLPGATPETTTELSGLCNTLSESAMRYEELRVQIEALDGDKKAKKKLARKSAAIGASPEMGQIQMLSKEAMEGFVSELRSSSIKGMESMLQLMLRPGFVETASIGELRRSLYYCVQFKQYNWLALTLYSQIMKILCVEYVRRMNYGLLAQDDVIYISTFVCVADYYHKPLWTALEYALERGIYTQLEKGMIRSMSTKLFRSFEHAQKETLDLRRLLLKAMSRRIGELVNELELPQILRIIQCYTVHDIFPKPIFDLATRAMMNVHEYNAKESATLCMIFRKWRVLTPEVCERLLEKIATSERMDVIMVVTSLQAARSMYRKLSITSAQTELEKQKLRQLAEKIASRLNECIFRHLGPILSLLDCIIVLRLYLPQNVIQTVFAAAGQIMSDPRVSKRVTLDMGRQLLGFLEYFGVEHSRQLAVQLRKMFKDGVLEEEQYVL